MKRLVLSAVAISMLAMPTVGAQAAPRIAPQAVESHVLPVQWDKRHGQKTVVIKKHGKVVVRKQPERKPHWQRGQRMSDWQRRPVVRDYGRHGLHRPARGQQWIKVGNDYVLIGIASGIIAGLVAGR